MAKVERAIHRGDIFWVAPEHERGALPGEAHPHLVLQDDVFNQSRVDTVIVCALTSNLQRMHEHGNVLLEPGEGNLPRQSVLVVSQLSSIEKSALGDYVGKLSSERVEQALNGLKFQQASFFNRG